VGKELNLKEAKIVYPAGFTGGGKKAGPFNIAATQENSYFQKHYAS